MLSRVAENLYWLGRYAERAENTARIIGVNAHLLLDLPRGIAPGWRPLVAITGNQADYEQRFADYDERSVVRFLLTDREHSSSVLSCLWWARENTRTVRDIVPREAWELLNELYHYAHSNGASGLSKRGRHGYLQAVVRGVQTLSGLLLGTMPHGEGYQFLTVGRVLERADMTTRIVDVRSSSLIPDQATDLRPFENIQWVSVLKSLSAYQAYRPKMHARIRRRNVLAFLLHDTEFPRSVARCTNVVDTGLQRLPRNDAPRRALATLQRAVARADLDALATEAPALHAFIDELQLRLAGVHDEIAATWFLSGTVAQSLDSAA